MSVGEYGLSVYAEKTPDKDFIVFGDRRITYGEGVRRVNRLARGLQSLGLCPSDRVAILSRNCPEYIEVSQAAAKIKAILVPVNYRLKKEEVEYVVADSESRALFVDMEQVELVRGIQSSLKNIGTRSMIVIGGQAEGMVSYEDFMAGFSDEEPEVENPHVYGATMGYTSGTTGLPKGVYRKSPHTEMSVIVIRELGLRNDDIHLVVGPFYHAAPIAMAGREIMLGATIVIMKRMDPLEFLDTVEREKVSTAFMAPIHLRYLFDLPQEELAKRDISSMRRIVVAGAPCPFKLKKQAVDYFGEGVLVEFYGSTDGGMNTVLRPEDQLKKPGSIGRPFPENEIIIVDENDKPLPPNQTGELLVYNPWLLDSYYKDPELTGKSFHGKYWRSGDVGYVDDEGYYYVVDRVKDMVISGGVNIYPVEIENVILSHPGVFDCCVFGVPDKTYGEALKAVVQLRNGDEATSEGMIQWVAERLADYKKPKSVEFVESLPRDQSGKIMKRYLRDRYWAGQQKKI